MKVYLAGPMTGAEDDGNDWRQYARIALSSAGISALLPNIAKTYQSEFHVTREGAAKVLTQRDKWFTTGCDVVLVNFEPSDQTGFASIGTCIELGWANEAGVPIVAVLPQHNVHVHPMVESLLFHRTATLDDAINFVRALNGQSPYQSDGALKGQSPYQGDGGLSRRQLMGISA